MQQKFDVFLNFRGEDVRHSFLSHLLGALNQAPLQIFVDDKIKRGDEISHALMSAIENSKLAITIFSKNYATSRWCLNELVKIMECTENPRFKQIVIPVFYHVTSSEVKSQSGSFAKAFTDHENSEYPDNHKKIPIWKAALKRAGGFSGRSVKEKSPEHGAVVDIVNDVLIALGRPNIDDSTSFFRLTHTLELQVKGNIWTQSSSSSQGIRIENLDSFLNMFKLQAHPSSSLPLEWNPQTNSSNGQPLTSVQTEGSTEWKPQTNSSNSQASKNGQSERSESTKTSSGPASEWKSKASTYGQSERSKSRGTSSASVQNTSYPTTEELYLPDARDKVVLFVTSSPIVKVIKDHCDAVREVLKGYGVSFDERSTSMSSHRKVLEDVLKGKPMQLPALFVEGDFIGGYEEIKKLKDSGELAEILQDFSARNRTLSYKILDHKSKKETETRPWSNTKGVSNTGFGIAKPEGSKMDANVSGNETFSYKYVEPKSKTKTDPNLTASTGVRPWSYTKGVSNADFGMVKSEGSKIDANVSTTPWSYTRSNQVLSSSSSLLSGTEDKIVLYFTSSEVSRRIYDDCRDVRMIFRALRVLVDERNTNAVPDYTKELKNVLKKNFSLPRVFIRGKYIGGVDEIRDINETGKLKKLVEGFPVRNRPSYCDHCGELATVSCPYCKYGKSCSVCNDTGMTKCPDCQS